MSNVYIAEISKVIPICHPAEYKADKLYPEFLYGDRINKLAKKVAKKFSINNPPSVLDYEKFPAIILNNEEDHPKYWGINIINKLTENIKKDEIGCFSLSYNITYHKDTLPNLATQIIMDSGLNKLDKNEEIPYYGCAASIYSIEQAAFYCAKYDRPAIVFTYDQCTTMCSQLDKDDPDFRKMLISNLLFSDAGVGLLLIPERLKKRYNRPLLKILDIDTKYSPGDMIKMRNGKFLMDSDLKNVIPKIVSKLLVKPFLEKNKIGVKDIQEWSIHQGGTEVIKQFCKENCLTLSEYQIENSLKLFFKYGNSSAASCLLVLEDFFNNHKQSQKHYGLILGFGAGYYMGNVLYKWD